MIRLYATAATINQNSPDKRSGCAVLLRTIDEHSREGVRIITHPAGNCTRRSADISAVRIALTSVLKKFRKGDTIIYIPKTVAEMLKKDDNGNWLKGSNTDVESIDSLRTWFGYYPNVRVETESYPDFDMLSNAARVCAEMQTGSDTGTLLS